MTDTETPAGEMEEDKTVAILSYLTIIGWIVAFVLHNGDKKTSLGGFHLRQTLGIFILSFCVWIAVLILSMVFGAISFGLLRVVGVLSTIAYLGILVLLIIGFIAAIQGQKKPVPFVGEQIQKLLASVAK